MSRDWETCSTNHESGVEDKAIHRRRSSKAWGKNWVEVNGVNSAQRYGIAEMKLEQPQDSQVSEDKSQSEWLSLRRGRQSYPPTSIKQAWSESLAEVNGVNSAQWYGIAEMKLEQPQDSQVSGDKSQSEWLSLRQPDFGDLLATVRIARKREFRIKFEILHAG